MPVNFRAPVAIPLYPIGAGTIPPGAFRVTRSFGDMTFPQYGPHDGLDVGNGRTHDPVVAIAAGRVTYAGFDPASGGAGIVRLQHDAEWSSGYAHLDRIDVKVGQTVSSGQPVGILGSTGWVTAAHLHFDITRNGKRVDPWPLLQEDDVKISGKFLRHVQNRKGVLTSDSNFREGVIAGEDEPIGQLSIGTLLYPVVVTEGRAVGAAPDRLEWYGAIAYEGGYNLGYVHSSVLPRTKDGQGVALEAIESAGGFTQAQMDAAKAASFTDAKAKAAASVQGIRP